MSVPGSHAHDSTREAIALAAEALSGLDASAHVFLEDREDVRIRLANDGARECTRTRSRGASVVGRTTVHRSDPGIDELLLMAVLAAGRGAPPIRAPGPIGERPAMSRLPEGLPDQAAAWLAADAADHFEEPGVRIEVRIVRFNQTVWVGRPFEPALREGRAGHRIEVRATCRAAGRVGEAIAERALGPTDPFPYGIVDSAVRRARERFGSRRGPGRWSAVPAIFAPSIAGVVVHELIGHSLEGDIVARGASRLTTFREPRLPRELTVVEDPHRGRAPWTIDDEGTSARPVVLVEGGRVTGVLHDVTTARAAGAESTGHGRRASYLDRVLPRLGCTFVAGGHDDPRSILEGTPTGVFLRRIVAANVDAAAGVATFLVTDADAIEQGRLTYPLEPFPIVIDIEESLRSMDAIGDDLEFDRCVGSCVRDGQPVAVSVGAPTIRLGVIKALL